MDVKLRQIVSESAGTYFIVSDNRENTNIESENKLRLYFINSEKGPINMLVKFAKGDTAAFKSVFGKATRMQEKKGNFSISTCLDALGAGPIAVINLRNFTNADVAGVIGMNPNVNAGETKTVEYSSLFNRNGFWVPKAEQIANQLTADTLLNFGNVASQDLTIIVTKAQKENVSLLTNEGEKTLRETSIEIDEYPALDFDMLLGDSFVDVYVFNNTFTPATVGTNKYYGHLFNAAGELDLTRIDELTAIKESGFVDRITGSVIPDMKSETDAEISIDTLINATYTQTGVICKINDDILEAEADVLDLNGLTFFDAVGAKIVGTPANLLSYVVPANLTTSTTVDWPMVTAADNVVPNDANEITYGIEKVTENQFISSFEQGLRIGDKLKAADGKLAVVTSLEILDAAAVIGVTQDTFTKIKVTADRNLNFERGDTEVIKVNLFVDSAKVLPTALVGYKPRKAQFIDGSATKQDEILGMMLSPGIVKGIKGTRGIRYVVDCFKSFVEPSYKWQFGQLMQTLDKANRFVRAIINEPFVEDMDKSINPLFKQTPTGVFDIEYLADGGNKNYSTKFLSKFSIGASMCFFFGPGDINRSITKPLAGLVSNAFYTKSFAFDIVANETGYIDGVNELEHHWDDDERKFLEKFCYNPVILIDGAPTIYGERSGSDAMPSIMQVHNSELLAYVKENLYNLAKSESFKKGTFDDYLRTETEVTNFMESLVTAGAILANPVVQCDAENNTQEISKAKIKLIHVEYTGVDALEKVVFDLELN